MGACSPADGQRKRVLVAGIGNIFLADDGFGVEVVRRLRELPSAAAVQIADFGIRAIHLAYELAGGAYDAVVLVDAVRRGGEPGTLYLIEPVIDAADASAGGADAHSLTPDTVLGWLARLGAVPERLVVIGCEPESIEESVGLSAAVEAAVERAVAMTLEVVQRLAPDDDAETSPPRSRAGVAPCA